MEKVVKSANEAAEQIIEWGESHEIETCFDRAEEDETMSYRSFWCLLQGLPYGTMPLSRTKCRGGCKGSVRCNTAYYCFKKPPEDGGGRDCSSF